MQKLRIKQIIQKKAGSLKRIASCSAHAIANRWKEDTMLAVKPTFVNSFPSNTLFHLLSHEIGGKNGGGSTLALIIQELLGQSSIK